MKHFFTSLKFMLSALLLCLAIGAQAGDVVFNGTTDTNGKTDAGEDQLTKNGVTLSVSRGLLASSNGQYRTYKGETLTISSTVGAITKVVFTCTAKDDAQYGPGCFTAAPGNYSFEGNTGTWNGAANEVVFTAGSNQVRATEIVVTVDGDTPVDPDPVDPDPEDPSIHEGDTIFFEPFTDVADGNDYDTGSSGSLWNGNSNFTSVTTAYQAGGAVRLGTSKKVGTLTTRAISFAGGKLIVEIDVKGWTSVEGTIQLCVDGGPATSHAYKATITDAYETLRIDLKDVPKNPYFTISTSEKRCFIDEIRVLVPKNDAEAIELLPQDSSYVSDYVDLSGRRYKNLPKKKGVYIHHRKKIVRY